MDVANGQNNTAPVGHGAYYLLTQIGTPSHYRVGKVELFQRKSWLFSSEGR
jgi:hypothetical protein